MHRSDASPSKAGAWADSGVAAFTLIELLSVIVIVGILAAVLIPTTAAARAAADRARTRVQFSQWALACAQFRQEYGFLPVLGTENRLATLEDTAVFIRTLTGRNPDGTPVADPADLGGNLRRLAFVVLAEADLRGGLLVDAFGNSEFGVLADRDGDGLVRPAVDGAVAAVRSVEGSVAFAPEVDVLPAAGVRAEVIFYSAGRGRSIGDLVLSWK